VKNIGGKRSAGTISGENSVNSAYTRQLEKYREYLEPLYKILDDHAEE